MDGIFKMTLYHQIQRVNYQTCIWKSADVALPDTPEPTEMAMDGNSLTAD